MIGNKSIDARLNLITMPHNNVEKEFLRKCFARPAGLEPATLTFASLYGVEIRCSIQLNYGRTKHSNIKI